MAFDLNSFSAVFDGGARSYLFEYTPSFPNTTYNATYFVKSTSYPDSTVEEIQLAWKGLKYKIGGTRTYNDWTVSFHMDKNYNIREYYDDWMKDIAGQDKYGKPEDYVMSQTLYALGYDGTKKSTIKLFDAWPKSVGEISFDNSAIEVATFDVTFAYQYYTITK